jgi:Flp pilus assembly protein TadD
MMAAAESNRIAQLIESAERALAEGRNTEAANLLAEAEALAPSDQRVLTALGVQALRVNDLPSARQHLERAAGQEPRSPVLWLNLA